MDLTRKQTNILINISDVHVTCNTSLLGDPFLKAFIKKEPDKTLYDLNEEVKLECTLDNKSGNVDKRDMIYYEMEWYKLLSDPQQPDKFLTSQKSKSRTTHFKLGPLTEEKEGTYKCVVKRLPINYYDFQLVNIKIKGK
jgi:hypothetical protein